MIEDGPATRRRRPSTLGSIKVNGDPRRNDLPLPICGLSTSYDECSEPAATNLSTRVGIDDAKTKDGNDPHPAKNGC